MKLRNYKFTFNLSALILFAIIMLPNIIWAFIPAPNDILKNQSAVPVLDIFVTFTQVALLATLCVLKNKSADKFRLSPFVLLSVLFFLFYYVCWTLYYCSVTHFALLICLCLFPCASFLCYAIARKNHLAFIPLTAFTVLHLLSTAINFV